MASVAIHLTEAGAALQDKANTVPLAIGEAMGLTPSQHTAVQDLLRLLTANLTAN